MDSDPFDDIFSDNAVKNARAGSKFQPKAKPRPLKKDSTVSLIPSFQGVPTTGLSASKFTESREAKNPSEPDDGRSSGTVNASSEHAAATENVDSIVNLGPGVNIFIPESNEDWNSCFEKSVGENADIFIGLESLGDFLPDSSAVLDNAVPSSEAPPVHVPGCSNTEEGLANPLVPAVDDSACFSNVPSISSRPEISAAQDPSTGQEPIISTSHGGCPTNNRNLEMEVKELESYPCLETLDMSDLSNGSGRRVGKFQPKPKLQSERSDLDLVEPVPTVPSQQDSESVPPEINFLDQGSVPVFTQNDVLDFSSVGLSRPAVESASEVVEDEEHTNPMEPSHPNAGIPGEHFEAVPGMPGKLAARRAKTGKSRMTASDLSPKQPTSNQADVAGRLLRKRLRNKNLYQFRDESEDEDVAGGDLPAESPTISAATGNNNGDEEFQLENESQTKKVRKKSKKTPGDKEKQVRKQIKDNETSDQAAKAAPKKFSHSTRRRRVNKTLLETPEDEIDFQKVPLRDLILLAEHKEQMAKKDAATSQAPLPNQSSGSVAEPDNEDRAGDAFQQCYDDEAFASEQGREANDEESSPRVQENTGYFNYQTYMDRTPTARWSKQDTELFYEAVQQFGTDLSMIQQLFPVRTRRQIKLKYKREENQHPLRLRDALTNRAKDLSHFELVIDRLKQIAAEEKQNSNKADSVDLTGEEEAWEETSETNDNEGKSEQIDEDIVENTQPDFTQVQSPVKSYDSEDDLLDWSQYKSED